MQTKAFGATALLALMATTAHATPLYEDVSATHLPLVSTDRLSMDADAADVDGDGDLDIIVANEWRPNFMLLNDGTGHFTLAARAFDNLNRDSEDVGIADFNGDGRLDVIIVSEDDQVNEYYQMGADGIFISRHDLLPRTDTTDDILVADINGDGAPDVLLGNHGQNAVLINAGDGTFRDETADRLPAREDVTQDLHLGDIDGDGDLDILEGNEGDNRLLLNDGMGHFTDAPADWLPLVEGPEETREADFGDADGDGDLDIIFGNVRFGYQDGSPYNRLLLNDGTGRFTDVTGTRFPSGEENSAEVDFADLDGDGDLDIIVSNVTAVMQPGDARWLVFANDGTGNFTDATEDFLPESAIGNGFDAVQADFNGDGLADLYLANRIGPDVLLFRTN